MPVIGEPGWDNATVRESAADLALRGAEHARQTLDGGFTTVQRADGASFQVGDRVRVRGIELELLAP